MWLLWLIAFIFADVSTWLPLVLEIESGPAALLEQGALVRLPIGAQLVGYSLAHPVYRQLGKVDYSHRELLLQVLGTKAVALGPILCVLWSFQRLLRGQSLGAVVVLPQGVAIALHS